MNNPMLIVLVGAATIFGAACSSTGERSNANTNTAPIANTAPAATNTANSANATSNADHAGTNEDVPAVVRAALPQAGSITKQHKDISASQISAIERETNTKISDTDHHSYLGFTTNSGARRQTGAATVVEAAGKQMVIVYENRNGVPYIREVRAEGVLQAFLDQFKGKGHDDKFQIGQDLKSNGVDDQTARAAAAAIRQDAVIMQTLYGSAHSH